MQNTANVKSIISAYKETLPKHWVEGWLLHVLQKPSVFLITDSSYELTKSEQSQFYDGIKKMQAGTPLAYLTGYQEFWSLLFKVNEHTLIPRPDTEVLVETVLQSIVDIEESLDIDNHRQLSSKASRRLLDLGTGSGCIAISLAYELEMAYPNVWHITAVDISSAALNVAKSNATLNQVHNINFVQSSWFDNLLFDKSLLDKSLLDKSLLNSIAVSDSEKFDVIVSNPPYIISDDPHLEVLTAEPISALVADDAGLADIKYIVTHASQYLRPKGLLAVEHGHDQGQAVKDIFCDAGFHAVKTVKDYGNNDRVTLGISMGIST